MTALDRMTMELRVLLVEYARATGYAPSTVTKEVTGDPNFAARISAGHDMKVSTYDKALAAFSRRWPPDLPWPAAVTRPAPDPQD